MDSGLDLIQSGAGGKRQHDDESQDRRHALARTLKGLPPKLDLGEAFEITRSLPHGHVAAVLGTARALGIEQLIEPAPSRRHRDARAARARHSLAAASGSYIRDHDQATR